MFATDQRTGSSAEAPSRRLDEIRELEAIWSISERRESAAPRHEALRVLLRYRTGVAFAAAWLAFMGVLFAFAPASDPALTPGWVTNVAGIMLTALLLAPLGLLNRAVGYGATTLAAGCGLALGAGCFSFGHAAFWPGFQVAGFAVLAVGGGAMLARSLRS